MSRPKKLICAAAVLAFLAGCATVSPDGGVGDVQKLTRGKTAGGEVALGAVPTAQTMQAVTALLAQPLDDAAAVRIA
ncbi:MAG: TolC family protein, partial [Burkholderiaceae bacterium]